VARASQGSDRRLEADERLRLNCLRETAPTTARSPPAARLSPCRGIGTRPVGGPPEPHRPRVPPTVSSPCCGFATRFRPILTISGRIRRGVRFGDQRVRSVTGASGHYGFREKADDPADQQAGSQDSENHENISHQSSPRGCTATL
jgi:hypothetical protein